MGLDNPDDPRVIEALKTKCGVCSAEPGVYCRSLTGIRINRLIHLYRIDPS